MTNDKQGNNEICGTISYQNLSSRISGEILEISGGRPNLSTKTHAIKI